MMMMKSKYFAGVGWVAAAVIVCSCSAPAFAIGVSATSSAELITDTEDPFFNSYKYTFEMTWDFGDGGGASHWDVILCGERQIGFDDPAGTSTPPGPDDDPPGPSEWVGYYETNGDSSVGIPEGVVLVKWNNPTPDPWSAGSGTFWFYSTTGPGQVGTFTDRVVVKDGTAPDLWGNLVGVLPGCEPTVVIPEPLTMVGMFMGVCGLGGYIRRKRRRA